MKLEFIKNITVTTKLEQLAPINCYIEYCNGGKTRIIGYKPCYINKCPGRINGTCTVDYTRVLTAGSDSWCLSGDQLVLFKITKE